LRKVGGDARAGGRGPQHQQGALRRQHHGGGAVEGSRPRHRQFDRMRRHQRDGIALFRRHIFRQFQMDRAGAFFLCHTEGLAHHGRDHAGRDDLVGELGERTHRRHHIDDLEARLARGFDALLPGDQDQRHAAQQSIGRCRGEVEGAWPQCRDADAGLAGKPAIGCRHEGRRLFVTGEHQLDLRLAQRFDHVEIFLARHTEDAVVAFVLVGCHQELRTLSHAVALLKFGAAS
jgi:hypothetical protein